jgi:nucleoid-associated protein YgaU
LHAWRRREYVSVAARNPALNPMPAIPTVDLGRRHSAATEWETVMSKLRFRSYLDQALFVLLIMAGAAASAVFDVRSVMGAMAAGQSGRAAAVAATLPAAPPAPVAAASAPREPLLATIVARAAH